MEKTLNQNLARLEEAKRILQLTDKEVQVLAKYKRIKKGVLQVGKKKYPAWRILHNDTLGPGKGGIRFHPQVSEDEVKMLSFCMSLKTSLMGLPFGGAKGGVKCNPKELLPQELEQISRAYIDKFYPYLGQDKDIPAPDVYTNPQIMAWMLDEYEKKTGRHEPAMITGKPIEIGGCLMRTDATARGGFIIINELSKTIGKKQLTVAIQGFGNAGALLAEMLFTNNYKIVAASDSQSGIYDAKGINIKKLASTKKEKGNVAAYDEKKQISNAELLELDVDILVLAALEDQITTKNADKIKTKYIVEIANGPISTEADKILNKKNVIIVPDILANSGGVVASYFEWCQNKSGEILEMKQLEKRFQQIMKESWQKVYQIHQTKKISLRAAAYVIAIERILKAEKLRGN